MIATISDQISLWQSYFIEKVIIDDKISQEILTLWWSFRAMKLHRYGNKDEKVSQV